MMLYFMLALINIQTSECSLKVHLNSSPVVEYQAVTMSEIQFNDSNPSIYLLCEVDGKNYRVRGDAYL